MKRNPEELQPKDPAQTVAFNAPFVSPGVADPAARNYAADIAARRGVVAGRYTTPVAGGPTPPIPALAGQHASGLTMADQANLQRAEAEGPPQRAQPRSMFQPAPPVGRAPGTPPPVGILPSDILPEEARQDPAFKEGAGSMYASAQPELALRYGVLRNKQRIPPQQLAQMPKGGAPLQTTPEQWQTIADFQGKQRAAESEDQRIEKEAAAGPAGAAGRFGNAPSDGPRADPAAGQRNLTEAVKKLDDFDFNTFREMMLKDLLNNEEQRELIEARCEPLDLTDLIVRGFTTQRVPIIPGKFEPEFRSMEGTEDLAIKRLIMQESKGLEVSDRYLLDKFSLMGVTVGLYSINGNVVPSHQNADGKFDEDKFWKKFEFVTRYPFHMLGSLGVNYFWFDIRVRKLFVAAKLKNG
jgi:hypothetical protein